MEFLKLGLFIVIAMFLPGYLLSQILLRKTGFNTIEQVPIWFVLSLGIFTIPAILAYIIPTTLNAFLYLIFATTALLAFIYLVFIKNKTFLSKDYDWTCLTIFLLALMYAVIIYKVGGELKEDTSYHMVLLKKLISRPHISLMAPFYKDSGPAYDYNYSLWHLLLATAAKFSGLSIRVVWFIIPGVLTPLAIIVYYTLAKTIFQNRMVGLVTTLILIGCLGGIWHFHVGFNEMNAPYAISRYILIPAIWIFLFSYIYKKQKIFLGLAAFLPLTLSNIHAFYFFLYMTTLSGFALLYWLVRRADRKGSKDLFIVLLLSVAVVIPYLSLRYASYKVNNPWFLNPHLINKSIYFPNSVVMVTQNLGYIDPNYIFRLIHILFQEKSPAQFYAFLVMPGIFFYLKRHIWASFLCGGFIAIIGIMIHPLLAATAAKIISYSHVVRMSDILPTFLILGVVSSRILAFSFKKLRNKAFIPSLLSIILLISAYRGIENLIHQLKIAPTVEQINLHPKVYNFLDKDIPGPAVIFSDDQTSLLCLTYANHYIAIGRIVDSANDPDSYEKIRESAEVLNPSAGIDNTLLILKKYEVEYILLSPRHNTQSIRLKFERRPDLFKRIFEEGGYVVYEVVKQV